MLRVVSLRVVALVAAFGGLSTISGCGGGGSADRPATVPVSGTVLYQGAPVGGASVSFWAEGAPRAATGVTNDKGEFQLSMFSANDGAVPGEHVITVTKIEGGAVVASPQLSPEDRSDPTKALEAYQRQMGSGQGPAAGPKNALPEKYAQQTTSPLKETVSEGATNSFVLQLTD